jgi:hypothetical protein
MSAPLAVGSPASSSVVGSPVGGTIRLRAARYVPGSDWNVTRVESVMK